MYIVSWEEDSALPFGNGEKEKKFNDSEEDEAYEFYNSMKKKQSGLFNGFCGTKNITDVRIRKV